MFKMITWPQYLGVVATLLVLYYLYVAAIYYRQELKALVSRKPVVDTSSALSPSNRLPSKGPLIPRPATLLFTSPAELTTDESETQTSEKDSAEEEAEQSAEVGTTETEDGENEEVEISIDINPSFVDANEKSTKFTEAEQPYTAEAAQDDLEQDFTVGVTQLNDYLSLAADGEITQEELIKEVPALANTELIAAFYKTSNQNSQQITAALFADMPAG
ncbi:hypothetical protein [Hymenobacter defluvii]|uniref:Uncharacterized protein n=1 Tax=Hymenobacter defluvii TaxID=2054411 RepID=A0ABS3TH06_9BACT|nr:hypothetical protein [Hymenobacter defluvii]MBO3272949.1 hypothetical protein [Hymenobacter defluvii]